MDAADPDARQSPLPHEPQPQSPPQQGQAQGVVSLAGGAGVVKQQHKVESPPGQQQEQAGNSGRQEEKIELEGGKAVEQSKQPAAQVMVAAEHAQSLATSGDRQNAQQKNAVLVNADQKPGVERGSQRSGREVGASVA